MLDVLAVSLSGQPTVRIIAQNKSERSAEGIVEMAVIRRGVETEFFTTAPTGSHKDGDLWNPDVPTCVECGIRLQPDEITTHRICRSCWQGMRGDD